MSIVTPVLLPPLHVVPAPSLVAAHGPRSGISSCLVWGLSLGSTHTLLPCWGCSVVSCQWLQGSAQAYLKNVAATVVIGSVMYSLPAQLMASFVTFLSVVYMAVTVQINRLHFFNITFTKLGCVMYKSANRMFDCSLSFCGASSD